MAVTKQQLLDVLNVSIEKWDKIAAGGNNNTPCALCKIFVSSEFCYDGINYCPLFDYGECANYGMWYKAERHGRHNDAMKEAAKLANIMREKRDDILSGKDTRWPDELEENFIINNGYCADHSEMDIVVSESGNLELSRTKRDRV